MKLLFCKSCNDLFSLHIEDRTCQCGETGGYYKDNKQDIVIYGHAIPVGINNNLFLTAVDIQNDFGEGVNFEAYVMPKNCPTVTYKDYPQPQLDNIFGLDFMAEVDDLSIYKKHEDIIEELEEEKEQEISNKVKRVKNVFKDKDEEQSN